jgi:hypothetical protein
MDCSYCGGTVAPDADRCPHCGTTSFYKAPTPTTLSDSDSTIIPKVLLAVVVGGFLGYFAGYVIPAETLSGRSIDAILLALPGCVVGLLVGIKLSNSN